mgnify:FL=1|jgi:hypothetical protein
MAAPDPSLVLQDLLSPPCEALAPRALAQQLVLQLSTVPLERPHLAFISLLTRYAASSGALWDSPALVRWDRCMLAYEALRQSVALRLSAIARPATPPNRQSDEGKRNSGWSACRSVKTYLNEICTGLWADPTRTSDDPAGRFGTVDPLIRLAMASGILAALQEWKRNKERLWIGGRSSLPRVERETGQAWRDYLAQKPLSTGKSDSFPQSWLSDSRSAGIDQLCLYQIQMRPQQRGSRRRRCRSCASKTSPKTGPLR